MAVARRIGLAAFVAFLGLGMEGSLRADDPDEVIGAIWEVSVPGVAGAVRQFRAAPDGKIWSVPNEGMPVVVGRWTGDPNDTRVVADRAGKASGFYHIVKVGKQPPSWKGTWKPKGKKRRIPINVRLVQD